ncbi:NADPH-dependent 3-demethoxyubiquinone 3-hydroxylase, mitochondrial-like [Tubulanus polymorphus]|uniref:NADPH-dependent 3-demethoxyubiquinone 3-hydroxylase, mitochondrial-like n=1 Tax=Tubulanus polymorphus TaxID=672921 RepID=UPI003DA382A8
MFSTHSFYRCMSKAVRSPETRAMLDRMIRVNHAGEFGANRIYEGQMSVLGKTEVGPLIQEMWEQEKVHLKEFERLIPELRVRPTAMLPIWNLAGYALGAGTALLGKEAAMACTVAVEDVIGEHYDQQIRQLMADDPEAHKELLETIKKFRDEELGHLDIGMENDAEQAPLYQAMSQVIKFGCKGAIWISERV